MQKERNYLFDNLKLFLIICVVYGHVIERYINNSGMIRSVYMFIYFFHMPLFIFVSGYFSKNVEKVRKNAIKDLLIPYIVFNIILSIYDKNLNFDIFLPGWTLWYLLSLFFWRFLLKYISKIKYGILISFIVALIIGGINNVGAYISLSRTITFLPFFLIGYYTKEEHLRKLKSYPMIFSILGLVGCYAIAVILAKYKLIDYKFLYLALPYKSFKMTFSIGILYRLATYIMMLLSSVFIIRLIPSKKLNITKFGQNTLIIYLGHIYFIKKWGGIVPPYNSKITILYVSLIVAIGIVLILSLPIFERIYNYIFLKEGRNNSYIEEIHQEVK